MKRIAALALVAALGATAASAEEIKPVTSTQASLPLLGFGGGITAAVVIPVVLITAVIVNEIVNDNSGT